MSINEKNYLFSKEEAQLCRTILRKRLQKIGFKLMSNDSSIADVAAIHKELHMLSSICEKLEID